MRCCPSWHRGHSPASRPVRPAVGAYLSGLSDGGTSRSQACTCTRADAAQSWCCHDQ